MVRRDPEGSRRRILEAAVVEFADHGLAGARVDAIALGAGVSKQLLFYYFGSKELLFRAAIWAKLEAHMLEIHQRLETESLVVSHEVYSSDTQLVRMLMWEALEVPDAAENQADRTQMYATWVARIAKEQAEGRLNRDFDPAQLVLLFLAEGLFPSAFPQLARLVTGHDPASKTFQRQRGVFIQTLLDTVRPRS